MRRTIRVIELAKCLATACLVVILVAHAHAEMACPVMLFDGKVDQEELELTFMNTAKVPIRQLEFYCTPVSGHTARRSVCHVETGIFYPGTPYPIRFDYASKTARTIVVSLKSAQLSEGYMWTSIHDQACRSLRVSARKK